MTSWAGILADLEQDQATMVSSSPVPADRRSKLRYPLELAVRFRMKSGRSRFWRAARTVNMSSTGVLVLLQHVAQHGISAGTRIEIRIDWPSLLDKKIPLQLVASGRVRRLGESVFAATFERHQFRTMRSSSPAPVLLGNNSADRSLKSQVIGS